MFPPDSSSKSQRSSLLIALMLLLLLKEVGKKELRQTAGSLSERLRERTRMVPGQPKTTMPDPIVYRRAEATAYAAHRLPGVYSCTFRVLNEVSLW